MIYEIQEEDPIVKEVREARHRIASFYGNNLRSIAEAAARGFSDFVDSCDVEPSYWQTTRIGNRDMSFA